MIDEQKLKTCCFFGHRKIEITDKLIQGLTETAERLITENGVDTFLFGSRSEFDDLCHTVVTKLKEKYPHIKLVYVRAEFSLIDEAYKNYLLTRYDETYFPKKIEKAGRARYVERNYEMIRKSKYCVIYYDEEHKSPRPSGTETAYKQAVKCSCNIINLFLL